MDLFSLYMLFFGLSTIIGVPLLSSFQVTQIKGSGYDDWLSGLAATLGPATGIFILISVVTYFMLKPLNKYLKDSVTRSLSTEEILHSKKIIKKVNLISTISILVGYVLGNGTTIIIKTALGKVNYNTTDIIMILILIVLYALMAVEYSVTAFNAMSRKQLSKLKIYSVDGMKISSYSFSLMKTITKITCLIGWHLLCTGYSAVRHNWTSSVFFTKAFTSLIEGLIVGLPLCFIILHQLKVRFSITVKQIEDLRERGDLVSRLSIGTFDDFGRVMTEMNKLMDFLQNALSKLQNENRSVDSGAKDLFNISESSASGIDQVISSFQTMSEENAQKDVLLENAKTNIEKLNDEAAKISESMELQAKSEQQNAQSISNMVESLKNASDQIIKTKELSDELTKSSLSGRTEVLKTQQIIETIAEKSRKMVEVIQMITKVATQTNLLAMNAAIEASHAGVAGKGFSVVADEIRKLSVSTQKSANDIGNLITEINESIDEGSSSMKDTAKMFESIYSGIQDQSRFVETLSVTMEEQTDGAGRVLSSTQEIVTQINDVSSLIKNQASYTNEMKTIINNIVNLSEQVNNSMQESQNVISQFSGSIQSVKQKAEQNQNSVLTITDELNKFSL